MIIGATKSGTTSLHHYLSQHPQIYLPKEKETQFFTDDQLYRHGVDFYLSHYFREARRQPARGEATPIYFHRPDIVIPRLRDTLPSDRMQFILILRHPVQRAWSHYEHMVRLGLESEDFTTALAREKDRQERDPMAWFSYFTDGLYHQLLSQWFAAFGRDSFLILRHEELAADTPATLNRIFTFLGVDTDVTIPDLAPQNEAGAPASRWLMKLLMGHFKGAELIKRLVGIRLRRRLGSALRLAIIRPTGKREPMPDEIRRRLLRDYAADIDGLERLLGESFEAWRS